MEVKTKLPYHVGIIMDGNGRWATKRGLNRNLGHVAGAKNLRKLVDHIFHRGIKVLSVYAFSMENFKRDQEEVDGLMHLFVEMFQKQFRHLKENRIKVLFSGRREMLPEKVLASMDQMVEETKTCDKAIFHVCLNYSGQIELVDATRVIAQKVKDGSLKVEEITSAILEEHLYQQLPPLDFVIRTSGEQRISNFMLYQSAYAEYYFPKIYFPDFNEKAFDQALQEYQERNRRFGGNQK